MTLLNISGLSHHYAHGGFNGKHQHQAVLNNVSLTLKSGETVALLGRSGCGKSTLARLLVGLESPAQGNISWRGEPLAKLNRAQRKAFRRDIQMVFQDSISAVNPSSTAVNPPMAPSRAARLSPRSIFPRIMGASSSSATVLPAAVAARARHRKGTL